MKGFSGPISTWPTNFPVPGALERTAYPFSLLQRLDQILWNFYLIVWQHSNTKITRAAPRPHTGTSTWLSCTHTGPQAQRFLCCRGCPLGRCGTRASPGAHVWREAWALPTPSTSGSQVQSGYKSRFMDSWPPKLLWT